MGTDSACCITSAECVQKCLQHAAEPSEWANAYGHATACARALKLENRFPDGLYKRMFLLTSSMASERTLNRGTA